MTVTSDQNKYEKLFRNFLQSQKDLEAAKLLTDNKQVNIPHSRPLSSLLQGHHSIGSGPGQNPRRTVVLINFLLTSASPISPLPLALSQQSIAEFPSRNSTTDQM
jgi:hypothetical protein